MNDICRIKEAKIPAGKSRLRTVSANAATQLLNCRPSVATNLSLSRPIPASAPSAAERGQQERDIIEQTRHKSVKVLRRYIRKGSLFQGNVVD